MSKFVIARKSPVFRNRTENQAHRNETHVAPQIDDEWERMYLDNGEEELCQNTADPRIIDDEYDEFERNYLSNREEMHIPLPQIDDDWEAMYLDDTVEANKANNDKEIAQKKLDQNQLKQFDLADDSSSCISSLLVLGFQSVGKIADNVTNRAYFEHIEDENEDIVSVQQFGNVGGIQDTSPAHRNETHVAPQIDDEWERMYLDDGEEELCQNTADPRIIDDEYDEFERNYLSNREEMYIPLPQIVDDREAMYLDDTVEANKANNDEEIAQKKLDQNQLKQFDLADDSSSCISSLSVLGFQSVGKIADNVTNRAYFEHIEDENEDIQSVPQFVNVGGSQDTSPLESEIKLSGRRIVDIGYLFKQIQAAGKHSENCHFEDMTLQHEIKKGLSSSFIFRCDVCGTMTRVETDQRKKNTLGINRDAILGITSVGLGFSHIEELCANIDVPSMSYNLFRKEEKIQQEDWFKTAKLAALKALMKEIELAKANSEVDSKGNALIRVITDGSWGKRSYGKYFSSLSGCAVIIGLRTNKVIYFDVRNKYCHICKLAEVKGETVKQHKCNKNYDGPSSAMESDIIVNGFKECDQLGARFNLLISDGDSNTYKMISDLRIYKDPDVFVVKLECVNHLYRNFYKKFNNLSSISNFDSDSRKKYITKGFCLDLCKGIRMASKHWKESDERLTMKIRLLEKDILNAPAHYFGYHEDCNGYFCKKTTEPGAVDTINFLKKDGLYYEIQSICQTYFGNNAKSLIANYTNNPAEQLNSYVAKYLGGKRINYSLAGSYTARVAMAVVHFNSECQASSEYRKMKLGGVSDMPCVAKLENKRKRKVAKNAVARAKKPRVRNTESGQGKGYGGDYTDDMEPTALEAAKKIVMEKLTSNQVTRNTIEQATKDDDNYYKAKIRDMLMAYYFSNIINSRGPKYYTKILEEIMYTQSQLGNNAQNKHQRVQEVEALTAFKQLYPKSSIQECGLFVDEELPYLGASPFRLFEKEYILSIKCPLSAYKKNIDKAKLPFWKIVSGKRTINKKSAWYLEIQGELHVTKKKVAYLMIWLGDNKYKIEKLKRKDHFFEKEIKDKMVYFFNEVMLKELANSRKAREMELRQYDEVTKTFL